MPKQVLGLTKTILLLTGVLVGDCVAELSVGFSERDITPAVDGERPVWIAGYGPGRQATGVHDPIMARCVAISDGQHTIALVSTDLVGVQYPLVKKVREQLPELHYVLVASTHNHEGPDVIGLWGRTLANRGVDDAYLELVVERVVAAVREATSRLTPVTASYGTAKDETLLRDSRLPVVYDPVLRVLRFTAVDSDEVAGLIVQWNCHPEALGSKNTLLTADFPYTTVEVLRKEHACPVVYLTGAVGGLMAPPGEIKDDTGNVLKDGTFEHAHVYGKAVAKLATSAVERAGPINLVPITASSRTVYLPAPNKYYRTAHVLGVLRRNATTWSGDPDKPGEPLSEENVDQPMAVETEVCYLRLGDLHVAGIPGELYPELVYGEVQRPADPAADFPDAPVEPDVASILPSEKWLLLGLANDEIGYIIPKRQWDAKPPFCYGRTKTQYGEINSCGPDVAPVLMNAFQRCVNGDD